MVIKVVTRCQTWSVLRRTVDCGQVNHLGNGMQPLSLAIPHG